MFLADSAKPVLAAVRDFIQTRIIPIQETFYAEVPVDGRFRFSEKQRQILEGLKTEAKEKGLWNLFLTTAMGEYVPESMMPKPALSAVDYAFLAEAMGASPLAAELFNCSAPDTGNMEVLFRYGDKAQQRRWLTPLLCGESRSGFAMTEPDVASSDAGNIAATAERDYDEYVINGEKIWVSGAGDPRCRFLIALVVTNPDASRKDRHSMIIVPMDAVGLEVVRPMSVFGYDDAPHGHMHVRFTNVRTPLTNRIGNEGAGLAMAQGRLGPGRIHHCMRSIGAAEQALSLMCRRAKERVAFGKPLAKLGGSADLVAESRLAIDQARLLTLHAAHLMDCGDREAARLAISKVKAVVPQMAERVIDRAIQMYGGMGLSQDTPLAKMWITQRALRLADGPDEVHRFVIGRHELDRPS